MPFCPECRAEYIEGTECCEDCRVPLVELLPEGDEGEATPGGDLVVLCTAPNEIEAQMIRAVLRGSRVECVFRGEALRLTHGFTIDGLAEVRIFVRRKEARRAAEIIRDYRRNRRGG